MVNDKLNEILDIEPIHEEEKSIAEPVIIDEKIETKFDNDIDTARKTQHELINTGKEALSEVIQYARMSESMRAWEAVNALLKTTSEIAQSLGNISLEKQKIDSSSKKITENNTTTNNIIFSGSTEELQKFLSEKKKVE